MPFNVWCINCEHHIGKGVRFNAKKRTIGFYFSTEILSFIMSCPSCSGWIEIQTDPKSSEYLVVQGGRRKTETHQIDEKEPFHLGDIATKQENLKEKEKLLFNPFAKAEHNARGQKRAKQSIPKLEDIIKHKEETWKQDWNSNQIARKIHRKERADAIKKIEPVYADSNLKILPETEAEKQVLYRKNNNSLRQKIINAPIINRKNEKLSLLNLKGEKSILDQLDFRNDIL